MRVLGYVGVLQEQLARAVSAVSSIAKEAGVKRGDGTKRVEEMLRQV
jgi:hypothetical protein